MRLTNSILQLILIFSVATTKKNARIKRKEKEMYDFLKEDDGQLADPYLGGYNSDEAKMLVVRFKPMDEISKSINPRWSKYNFKEMI